MSITTSTEHREDRAVLRFLALPGEAGTDGRSIQAGHVLEWIDRAGFACAAAWSGAYCVTAYVGNVHFTRPIQVGDIVEASARIVSTGRTSMHVLVRVRTADPKVGEFTPATHCLLVFVAVDDARRPRAVPQWSPRSVGDLDLADRMQRRIEVRARITEMMRAEPYTDEGTAPRMVLRFLAAPGDVNWGGTVHGGTLMRWIDEAAQTCATGWTHEHTFGVYAGGIHFRRPIAIGDVVEVDSRVIHTSRRSVHVATRVRSSDPRTGIGAETTQCMSISIVPDGEGHAAAVPPLPLVTEEDRRLDRHARALKSARAELDAIGDEDG